LVKYFRNRFIAQISNSGSRQHHLGMFDTSKEAAIAFDLAAIQTGRPISDLNFPNMKHVGVLLNKKKNEKKKKVMHIQMTRMTKNKKKNLKIMEKKLMMKCTNNNNTTSASFNGVPKRRKMFPKIPTCIN
jgi:hypothetical protein